MPDSVDVRVLYGTISLQFDKFTSLTKDDEQALRPAAADRTKSPASNMEVRQRFDNSLNFFIILIVFIVFFPFIV